MAISYPLSGIPSSPKPRSAQVTARSNVGVSRSEFSGVARKQKHAFQGWEIDLDLPPMTGAEAGDWLAFLLKLNGQEGTVLVEDPDRQTANGVATGTPLVKGGSQTGNSLITDGWTISTTDILKAGDLIQIGNYMYMVLNDVNSDGSGDATLDIFPDLRAAPADNAAITVANCKTLMRLSSNSPNWSTNNMKHYGLTISFVEELPTS
jgi:hypothetical protein